MRRSLTMCRNGLSVAAALVLLTACGGSDDNSASSDTSEASPSASESSAADSEFCTEAASIQERIGSTMENSQDPAALPQALQEAATEIRAIEAPEEIADDWNALADGAEQIGQAIASIDPNDPNALATLEQQVGDLTSRLDEAGTNVENYLRDECGIEPEGTETASPSS
jgi:hypothetical protein